MPLAFDSTAWISVIAAAAAALAAALTVALAAVGEVVRESGPMRRRQRESDGVRTLRRQRYWLASAFAVVLATLLAAAMGASVAVTASAALGAVLGARFVRGRALARRPCAVALAGSGMGLAVMSAGIARYLSAAARLNAERIELSAAVFIGAMMFATSAIAVCRLRGALRVDPAMRTGHCVVDLSAMLLCAWLGYGFVTEHAAPFGLAALLAMSALACALGAHLMINRVPCHAFGAGVLSARCEGTALTDGPGLLARGACDGEEESAWLAHGTAPRALRTSAYRHRRVANGTARCDAASDASVARRRRARPPAVAPRRGCCRSASRAVARSAQFTGRD